MSDQRDSAEGRKVFEAWIAASPYERTITRHSLDQDKTCWPGQYRDITVQLAWEAWCEGVAWHTRAAASTGPDQSYGQGRAP